MLALSTQLTQALGGSCLQATRLIAPLAAQLLHTAVSRRTAEPCLAATEPEVTPQLYEPQPLIDSSPTPGNVRDFGEFEQEHRTYPEAVWTAVAELVSPRRKQQPVAIDIAAHDSVAAQELARRGFNVLSVCPGAGAQALQKTLLHANTNPDRRVDVISAQLDPCVVRDGSSDVVTCMDGLHLLDAQQALLEAHRILRPGGKLVVAFSDRDPQDDFNDMLEEVAEFHAGPTYSRAAAQHAPAAWAPLLRAGGRFRLNGYAVHANPRALRSGAALGELLGSQPSLADALPQDAAAARAEFCQDIESLAEWRFGADEPVLLAEETRMYILEKVSPPALQ